MKIDLVNMISGKKPRRDEGIPLTLFLILAAALWSILWWFWLSPRNLIPKHFYRIKIGTNEQQMLDSMPVNPDSIETMNEITRYEWVYKTYKWSEYPKNGAFASEAYDSESRGSYTKKNIHYRVSVKAGKVVGKKVKYDF